MKYLSLIGILALFLVSFGSGIRLYAQEDKSIVEERKDTLKFGITSQILSVLETITEEKETGYTEEAESLFDTLRDPGVHAAVFHYFRAIDDDSLVERAAEVLSNHLDKPPALVASVIRYVAETGIEELEPRIFVIAESGISGTLSLDAVKALGELGDEETAARLLELYDESGVSEQVREQIILVLGKLQAEQAVDLLIDIARDEGESLTMRRFAADSLGRIGSSRAVDTLEELYVQDDPYLRANAVYSLGLIGGPGAEAILFAALRDGFWRIRVSAAEAIGEAGIEEGIDILTYKAQNDPELQVRTAAVEALGKIGGGKSFEFLKELAKGPGNPLAVRTQALEALVEEDLSGSIPFLKELFAEESAKRSSVILDPLARIISDAEGAGLAPLYEQMLASPSIPMKIYGMRGIRINKIGTLRDKVEKLTGDDAPTSVRRYAEKVLESF